MQLVFAATPLLATTHLFLFCYYLLTFSIRMASIQYVQGLLTYLRTRGVVPPDDGFWHPPLLLNDVSLCQTSLFQNAEVLSSLRLPAYAPVDLEHLYL